MTMAVSVEAVMASNPPEKKPRIIITADPELDDNNSLIRFLLYSTDFRVKALSMPVANSTGRVMGREPLGMYLTANMGVLA